MSFANCRFCRASVYQFIDRVPLTNFKLPAFSLTVGMFEEGIPRASVDDSVVFKHFDNFKNVP